MKTKLFLAATLLGVAALSPRAKADINVSIGVPSPIVVAPVVMVPDAYVWDGTENVGMVNGQYFYLGSDNAWMPFDHDRLVHFRDWERGHADWQTHAIRNDRYRKDARGNVQPFRGDDRDKGNAQPVRGDQRDKGNVQPVVNHGSDNHGPDKANAPSAGDGRSVKGGDQETPAKSDKKDDKQ